MYSNEDLIAEARGSFKATNASANLIHRLADALEASEARIAELEAKLAARQPSEGYRERIAEIRHRRAFSVYGEGTAYEDIGWLLDALSRAAEPDAREHLHAKCDCVPDLGPAHCHLCTGEGSPVRWEDCEAVRERRLLMCRSLSREMNIKEVDQ